MKRKMAALVMLGMSLGMTAQVLADDDRYKHDESYWRFWNWFGKSKSGVASVEKAQYTKKCGGCHFAYQPGLLPALSWERLMNKLDDHFGESVVLAEDELNLIRSHLLDNAAGRVNYDLSNKIMSALGDDPAPLRITETQYFQQVHGDIPQPSASGNPAVRSMSNCDSCHPKARQGSYRELSL